MKRHLIAGMAVVLALSGVLAAQSRPSGRPQDRGRPDERVGRISGVIADLDREPTSSRRRCDGRWGAAICAGRVVRSVEQGRAQLRARWIDSVNRGTGITTRRDRGGTRRPQSRRVDALVARCRGTGCASRPSANGTPCATSSTGWRRRSTSRGSAGEVTSRLDMHGRRRVTGRAAEAGGRRQAFGQ